MTHTQSDYDPHTTFDTDLIDQTLASIHELSLGVRLHADNSELLNAHVLDINFDENWIFLSYPQAQSEQLGSLESNQLTISIIIDSNYVEMQLEDVITTSYKGIPALKAALPDHMLKIQRRNSFRIQPPPHQAPVCTIPLDQPVELALFDISASGLSLIDQSLALSFEKDALLTGCILHLSDIDEIEIHLHIVRHHLQELATNKKVQRIGCAFVDLSRAQQQRIDFYINQQQRLLIAKERGLM